MKEKNIAVVLMVAFLLGISSLYTPVQAQIKLTYANSAPTGTFPSVQMERWAKEVEKRTSGKVKIQTFQGGTLLSAKLLYDGVISGQADISNPVMSYQPGRFPISEAFDLPVGFVNAKAASHTLYDLIQKYKPKEFEQVKILNLFTCPPANLMTSKPVKSLKDLGGMELRVAGTSVDIIKRLGGIPIAMPMPDTPEALQKGVVKGIVSSLDVLKDFNFASYCPYSTEANLFVVCFSVVMNKEKWNSLPIDVKKVFDNLNFEHSLWTATYVDDHAKEALEWAKQKHNHQIFQLTTNDKVEIPKLLKPIIDDYIKRVNGLNLSGDQIVKDIFSLKEKYEKLYK